MNLRSSFKYIIGIDEVGRGPIAGPVAVGAFTFLTPDARKLFRGVKECKQLTEPKREEWFAKIEKARNEGHVHFSVSFESHSIIDSKGLTFAIKRALLNSLIELEEAIDLESRVNSGRAGCLVLLDGGLKAPAHYENQRTIIKGDEKEMTIALASICAKVLRDRKMRILAKKHPQYGFEANKGYGTKGHYEAIRRHGLVPSHRRSFLKNVK